MDLLAMGKYGAYVWSAFGLTLVVVIICIVQARRHHRAVLQEIARRLELMETPE